MGYDTIYAVQDIEDDAIAGIKSTALMFGERTQKAVAAFYGLALVLAALALQSAGVGALSWLGWAGFAGHLGWQASRISVRDGAGALRLFRSNRDAGLLLFLGMALDALARSL
jgi:4-hydroxybenzoate polyprenyltransferase